jgi:2'-5' RNA ligase
VVLEKGKISSPPGIRTPEHSARGLAAIKATQTGSVRALWLNMFRNKPPHSPYAFMVGARLSTGLCSLFFKEQQIWRKHLKIMERKFFPCLTLLRKKKKKDK